MFNSYMCYDAYICNLQINVSKNMCDELFKVFLTCMLD